MNLSAISPRLRVLLALFAGALGPLAFSPVNIWLLGLVSVALYFAALRQAQVRTAALAGFAYGLGYFGVGASWIYVSIHDYGNAGPALSVLITCLFVSIMALYFLLQGWYFCKFAAVRWPIAGFSASWVAGEWLRGWLLTGFPWLYLGSAHVTSMFSGIAPLFGVLGISFVIALCGAIIGELLVRYSEHPSLYGLAKTQLPTALLILCGAASVSSKMNWVETSPQESITVGIVQGNIAQSVKFDPDSLLHNLEVYDELSGPLWQNDLVLWPETAIPMTYQRATEWLDYFAGQTSPYHSTLVTGIFYAGDDAVYNSITALGNGSGIWHKQKLVPFGEYVPFRSILSNLLQLFDLPLSSMSPGPDNQELLKIGSFRAAAFICYEVVYPDFVRSVSQDADFLVTISNDTWFGASWGPLQHLQIAAMRARELGRYMIRATNNGVSALINERGEIIARTAQFQAATLQGQVFIFHGHTPFSRWGSIPVLLISALLLIINFHPAGRRNTTRDKAAEF